LFSTIRSIKSTHQIEYCSFADWPEANVAERHILCGLLAHPRVPNAPTGSRGNSSDFDHDDLFQRTSSAYAARPVTNGYFCAPQVFWFEPHAKWYMIYQASDKA